MLKERSFVLVGGLGAAMLVVMLLMPPPAPQNQYISRPTSLDHGKFGLAGVFQWLTQQNIPTASLTDRYMGLIDNPNIAEKGNLLITVLPHSTPMRHRESEQLLAWLNQGNTILVLAAYLDEPQWVKNVEQYGNISQFLNLLGFDFEYTPDSDADEQDDEQGSAEDTSTVQSQQTEKVITIHHKVAVHQHPVFKNVADIEISGLNIDQQALALVGTDTERSSLVLLRNSDKQFPGLWQARVGNGTAWIFPYTDVIGNVALAKADNAKFVANLVAYSLSKEGKVIFDDMHQGITSLYDPEAFFSDARLHYSLLFIVALWLVYILGYSNRTYIAANKPLAPSISEHVHAIGGLFARRLKKAVVAKRLFQHFFNEIRVIHHLPPNGEPVWELISQNKMIAAELIQNTILLHDRALKNKNVNLIKVANNINQLRTVYL